MADQDLIIIPAVVAFFALLWFIVILLLGVTVSHGLTTVIDRMPPEDYRRIILEVISAVEHLAVVYLVWKIVSQMFDLAFTVLAVQTALPTAA